MWDDEDNNPYGSFHRRDSETSDIQSPTDRVSLVFSNEVHLHANTT